MLKISHEVKNIFKGKPVDLNYSKYYPTEAELSELPGWIIFKTELVIGIIRKYIDYYRGEKYGLF